MSRSSLCNARGTCSHPVVKRRWDSLLLNALRDSLQNREGGCDIDKSKYQENTNLVAFPASLSGVRSAGGKLYKNRSLI